MNKRRKKKLKWLLKQRERRQELYDEFGIWPKKHHPAGADRWHVTYGNGTTEFFFRDASGFVRGEGPCPANQP